jgi:biopolymer transport protein ExbD
VRVGGRRGGRRGSVLSEINVTPLVDVTLVLLIIFMVTAPALQQWLAVSLPRSTVGQADVQEGVVVTITRDLKIQIDQERVPYEDFSARFAAARTRIGDRPVFLRADEQVPYGKVVEIVGKIKSAGVDRLGLVEEIVGEVSKGR